MFLALAAQWSGVLPVASISVAEDGQTFNKYSTIRVCAKPAAYINNERNTYIFKQTVKLSYMLTLCSGVRPFASLLDNKIAGTGEAVLAIRKSKSLSITAE